MEFMIICEIPDFSKFLVPLFNFDCEENFVSAENWRIHYY